MSGGIDLQDDTEKKGRLISKELHRMMAKRSAAKWNDMYPNDNFTFHGSAKEAAMWMSVYYDILEECAGKRTVLIPSIGVLGVKQTNYNQRSIEQLVSYSPDNPNHKSITPKFGFSRLYKARVKRQFSENILEEEDIDDDSDVEDDEQYDE